MGRYFRISYMLTGREVVFPGNPPVEFVQTLSMSQGDSCNAWALRLFNHNGTHLDFPNHYRREGRKVSEYSIDELVFDRPYLVDVPRGEDESIDAETLKGLPGRAYESDLLLLRTGFGQRRGDSDYLFGPYLTRDAGTYLRMAFPHLRCLGLDCLSATNPRHREAGEELHRILLSEEPDGKPVHILEDVDLGSRELIAGFRRVFVVPLFAEEVDGTPCTVFGEVAS